MDQLSGSECKQISTTNYEEDSTLFSGEIDNQNDDDTCAGNIIMNRVNDYCLAEIFSYLPAQTRPKIALVCKRWKEVIDSCWGNVKKLELIYWNCDEYPTGGLTKFSTMDLRALRFIITLLEKCGPRLTKLDLTAYSNCNILPIINELCPNLVKLRLRFTHVDDRTLYDSFSRLSKLQKLTIIFDLVDDTSIPVTLIDSLRNLADTLTDLNLLVLMYGYSWIGAQHFPEEKTISVIRDLKALKIFGVAGINVSKTFTNYLIDRKIFFFNYYDQYRYKNYNRFHDRIELDLSQFRVTDDSLYIVANVMKFLKVLIIFCEWITDDGVVAISKIHMLDTLEFVGCNDVTDSSIKLLKNLNKLKLPSSNKITDYSVTKVLENSPNMKELYVEDTGVTVEFIKKAADISKHRKRLLYLYYSSVTFTPDVKQYRSGYFDIHIIQEKKQKVTGANPTSILLPKSTLVPHVNCEKKKETTSVLANLKSQILKYMK